MTRVVLAYEEGPAVGMGHRRRMEALGTALRGFGAVTDLVASGERPFAADVVVLDSYRLRADDPAVVGGGLVVAVDDLDRELVVDVVVDPSPGADEFAHRSAGRVLAGAAYALIDPTLGLLPRREVGPEVFTALVAGGGGATSAAAARVAADLAALRPALEVRVALPPDGPPPPPGVGEVRTAAGLGPALSGADLVVTAAGVTLLEALALGRPTVAMVLAPNQRRAAAGAAAAGAAVLAELDDAAAAAAILADDADARRACSAAAVALVDGGGAARVALAALGRA